MHYASIIIRKLVCREAESLHSSDKFALSGAIIGDYDDPVGIYLPIIRINSNEERPINVEYQISTNTPVIGLSLTALDIDDNDSWKESEEEIKLGSAAAAWAARLIPGYGKVVSEVISYVSSAVSDAINLFNALDENDKLLEFNQTIALPSGTPNIQVSIPYTINFKNDDPAGLSGWDYDLELEIRHTWIPTFADTPPPQIDVGARAAQMFRDRAALAKPAGFLAAFPNFHIERFGLGFVAGTIFVTRAVAEWRDVPLSELENVSLEKFEERMRVTNKYASKEGYVGGFPNYFHENYGSGIVCGTILLNSHGAEWEDVDWEDLGKPPLDDFEARFKATHDYAVRNGFVGGFPNLFHEQKTRIDVTTGRRIRYTVCGTVLLRSSFFDLNRGTRRVAEWRNVNL